MNNHTIKKSLALALKIHRQYEALDGMTRRDNADLEMRTAIRHSRDNLRTAIRKLTLCCPNTEFTHFTEVERQDILGLHLYRPQLPSPVFDRKTAATGEKETEL